MDKSKAFLLIAVLFLKIVLRSISTIKKIEFELFAQILNIGKKGEGQLLCLL